MAYSAPHAVREYLAAACLGISHQYVVHCQRRTSGDKRRILLDLREIDLCALIARFFGASGHLAAQGVAAENAADIEVDGPTIRAEVKYFRPSGTSKGQTQARAWGQLDGDWKWLLSATNNGGEFGKRAWVVFWPSISIFRFTHCLSVPKSHGAQYCRADFAPFVPYAVPELPANGVNQRLVFRAEPDRTSVIQIPNGKRVRCDLIGYAEHPIWAAVYTRITPAEADSLSGLPVHVADNARITI